MALKMQDIGELAYGGVVTLAHWWDEKRITAGSLTSKQLLKQAGFYSYLVIGLVATAMSTFGWGRRYEQWTERISHGFIYGLPGFIYATVKNLQGTAPNMNSRADAVAQAQAILRARQQAQGAGRGTNYEIQNQEELLV